MRRLLIILLAGTVAFMALAIAQEWQLFASAWFGDEAPPPPEVPESDRREAVEALRLTLELMGHLYRSGGDQRFADRMPASGAVIGEMMADVEYLGRNHRRQDPTLERLELLELEALAPDRLELLTLETWWVGMLGPDGRPIEAARPETVRGRYLMARGGQGWRLESWAFYETAGAAAAP